MRFCNITPEQKAYLLGTRYEAEKKKRAVNQYTAGAAPQNGERHTTAERIAAEVGVSKNTVERAGMFARAVDTLAADSPTIHSLNLGQRASLEVTPFATLI